MEIVQPLPNAPIGVGFEVRVQTDFIGPIELGSRYTAYLFPEVEEQHVARAQIYSQLATPTIILGQWSDSPTSARLEVPTQLSSTPHGSPARLQVTLTSPAGAQLDTTTIPVTYDALTGTQYVAAQISTTSTGDGFTSADRLVLGQVQNAVLVELAPGIISAIGGVMAGLPPNWWREECLPGVYVNSGTLTKPAGALSTAAGGLTWHVQDFPAGIGIDEGAPDRFEIDALELRFVLTLANGFHYTYDHRSSRELEGGWLWGIKTPTRIDYWIAPGIQMQFCWLVPTATPYWAPDTSSSIAVPNPFGIQVGWGR